MSVIYSVIPKVGHVQCCAKSVINSVVQKSCTVLCQISVMYSVVPKVGWALVERAFRERNYSIHIDNEFVSCVLPLVTMCI